MAQRLALKFWNIPLDFGSGRSFVGPDYPSLIWVLTRMDRIPDATRRTVPNAEEARCIRVCGLPARAGSRWICAPLPHYLVADNLLLRHLSDRPDLVPTGRLPSWWARRTSPFSNLRMKLILALCGRRDYPVSRRQVQQRFWRLGACFFGYLLDNVLSEGAITEYEGGLYPIRREDFRPELVQHYFLRHSSA